jgi:hypothetical protein
MKSGSDYTTGDSGVFIAYLVELLDSGWNRYGRFER